MELLDNMNNEHFDMMTGTDKFAAKVRQTIVCTIKIVEMSFLKYFSQLKGAKKLSNVLGKNTKGYP